MELRLQAKKLDRQAMKLAVWCGEKHSWLDMDIQTRNMYRKLVISMLTDCGLEVVLTDALTNPELPYDLARPHDLNNRGHVLTCQECYNKLPNGIRPHVAQDRPHEGGGCDDTTHDDSAPQGRAQTP